ncbi:hypothetical protein [Natronobacterium texcoconense]|uniref:Zinc-ribbon domain-containing protein n=1 Tax=Natronobacterium texcoconense TaxID=1095778 RepID=A0A1H1HPB3_NATTX|nr:hypothetical protein [Natronobacterium texcoconense]SDR27301.1 hypothetical protein SAMN04489842_2933 [Natronobacterium texcoconense]
MKLCESCGTEFDGDQTQCPDCNTRLTSFSEIDSYRTYLQLREQARDEPKSVDQSDDGSIFLFSVAGGLGLLSSPSLLDLLSYGVVLAVVGYGLAGIGASYWLGGVVVVGSAVCLTPQFRRRIDSNLAGIVLFLVLFLIGRSSPSTWLS